MEESDQELNISCLPVEVLCHILQYTDCRDITYFSATCRRLRDVILNYNMLWKNKYKATLPYNMFKSMEKYGNGNWYLEIRNFYVIKRQIYNELMDMSAKYYWQCYDISLEDVRNFFKIALEGSVNYYYVIYILQDLVWKTDIYLDSNSAQKPFTLTEMFYAKVALRHLTHTFMAVKWVSYHMKKELPPDIVVNYFLQWTDTCNCHSDHNVTSEMNKLAAKVKKVIDSKQPEWASLSLPERLAKNVLNERQILEAVSHVLYKQRHISVTTSVGLDTIDIVQALRHGCASMVTIAAIYYAVASRCYVACQLVAFPNHLYLEWRDVTDKKNPAMYSIDLYNGELKPKGRCPFSRTDHNATYKYCPDSLLQYIYTAFQLNMNGMKNWNTKNAQHLLDFLGTSHSQFNPYRNFLPYLIEHTNLPGMNMPLDMTHLKDEQLQVIGSLANLNPAMKPATKEFVMQKHVSQVKYAVGMVCYHKKFEYVGIIKAWDPVCDLKFADRMEMELNLHFGIEQPFYYMIAADQSNRYVAEENLYEMTRPIRLFHLEDDIAREFTHFNGFSYVPNEQKRSEYPEEGPIVAMHRTRCQYRPA